MTKTTDEDGCHGSNRTLEWRSCQ